MKSVSLPTDQIKRVLKREQTRFIKIVDPQPVYAGRGANKRLVHPTSKSRTFSPRDCPYGGCWERLWVAEKFRMVGPCEIYLADQEDAGEYDWIEASDMVIEQSRMQIAIASVSLKRMKSLKNHDAKSLGIGSKKGLLEHLIKESGPTATKESFVWVIDFELKIPSLQEEEDEESEI